MAKRDILDRFRAEEADIKKKELEAAKRNENLLITARQRARKMIEDSEVEAETIFKEEMENAKLNIDRQLRSLKASGDTEISQLKANAQARMDTAVNHIIEVFERKIDA